MQVELFKKKGKYVDKAGEEKQFLNFYIRFNNTLFAIEPKYFRKIDEKTGAELKDYGYSNRKSGLEMIADELPEKK